MTQTSSYRIRRVKNPGRSAAFGTFGWEVVRPDGSVVMTTNSKTSATESADKLNTVGHL